MAVVSCSAGTGSKTHACHQQLPLPLCDAAMSMCPFCTYSLYDTAMGAPVLLTAFVYGFRKEDVVRYTHAQSLDALPMGEPQ